MWLVAQHRTCEKGTWQCLPHSHILTVAWCLIILSRVCPLVKIYKPLVCPELCCWGGNIWKGLQNHHQLHSPRWKRRGGGLLFSEHSLVIQSHGSLCLVRRSNTFLAFPSCALTTSLTLWRVSTRLLATVELLNAGSGLTEQNGNNKCIPSYSADALISARRKLRHFFVWMSRRPGPSERLNDVPFRFVDI